MLHTPCTQVDLVDRVVLPLSAGVQPAALLLADIDEDGDNEIVAGATDGTLSIFKGRSTSALQVLTGFGSIVAVAHRRVMSEQTDTATSRVASPAPHARSLMQHSLPPEPVAPVPPVPSGHTCGARLFVVNSEGDLFVLEVSLQRMRVLARQQEQQLAAAEGRVNEPGAATRADEEQSLDSAEWTEQEESTSRAEGSNPAAARREHYASSSFLSSQQRFRVPINVSSLECCELRHDGFLSLVFGTLDCSMHVFTLRAERPAEELALEAAAHAAAVAREAAAAKEEEAAAAAPRGRLGVTSSPLTIGMGISGGGSRRPSLQGSLSQLGQPMLPGGSGTSATQSAAASHTNSPSSRSRVLSNHFVMPPASATTSAQAASAAARSKSPFPAGPGFPPQPVLGAAASGSTAGSSAASSASHTRTSSPTLSSSSIFTAINPQAHTPTTAPTPPRSHSMTPSIDTAAVVTPPPAPKITWLLHLDLEKQWLRLPHPVHALSSVSGERAVADCMRRSESIESLTSESGFDVSLPPSATSGDDTLSVPSNHPQLLSVWALDASTMHVLPSRLFQRSQALQKRHARAGSSAGPSIPPQAQAPSRSITSAAPNAAPNASSQSHSASSTSLQMLERGKEVGVGSLNPRPIGMARGSGVGNMLMQQQLSSSASNSTFAPRRHSSAQPVPPFGSGGLGAASMFQSPMLHHSQGNSSPRFGPSIPGGASSVTNSPRFSFLSASQATANHASYALNLAAQQASSSVTASPALLGLAAMPTSQSLAPATSPVPPAFSLGASVATPSAVESAPPTLLRISRTVLLVALEEGALLVDVQNNILWALGFPLPSNGTSSSVGNIISPSRITRQSSTGSQAASLPPSLSLNSLSTATPSVHSAGNPSASPPSASTAAAAAGRSATAALGSPSIVTAPLPPLQRTTSAPTESPSAAAHALASAAGSTLASTGAPTHSSSVATTPTLRPTQPPHSSRLHQPVGINLSALNNSVLSDTSPIVHTPLNVQLTPTPRLPTGAVGMETPQLQSPLSTPRDRSMANSRNVSYAGLPNLANTPVLSPQGHPPSAAAETLRWDVVRARLRGDVQLPPASGSASAAARSGVLAMLDALGRVSVQHLSAQMFDSSEGRETSAAAWYHYALQLPGQFLALSSLPMPVPRALSPASVESKPAAAGEMLTACSLDGWTYFIPTLPMQLPPLPAANAPALTDGSALPPAGLTLSRFLFPHRVSAFVSGLFSLSSGQPSPSLLFVTYQHELVVFPNVLEAHPVGEWKSEWTWRKEERSAPLSASSSMASTAEEVASPALDAALSERVDAALVPVQPAYILTAQSTRRTLLSAWRERDEAELASQPHTDTSLVPLSLSRLVEWTSSNAGDVASAPPPAVFDAAPYVRDLRSADIVLLHEYRALLRRRLGLDDGAEAEANAGENTPEGSRHARIEDSPMRYAEEPRTPRSPRTPRDTQRTPVSRTPASPSGRVPGASPGFTAIPAPPLHSSPLFASFKLSTHHFAARPLGARMLDDDDDDDDEREGRAIPPRAPGPPSMLRGRTDPSIEEERIKAAANPHAASDDKSPGFWRKLLRRTQ